MKSEDITEMMKNKKKRVTIKQKHYKGNTKCQCKRCKMSRN